MDFKLPRLADFQSERPDRTMAEECRENRPSRARDLPTALRLLASASGGRSGQGRVLQNRLRPFRPMGRGPKGGVNGAGSAGWSRWRGAGPRGQRQPAHWAGVAAATAVRVFKVSALPHRRPDSAAMSAAEEVDGLGVVRPHYGCECRGLGMRGRGARLGFSRGLSRAGARGGLGPHGPGRAAQLCGWQQGSRPIPLELRRWRVGTWRPQPEPGAAAGEPHPAPPPLSSTEIGEDGLG